MNQVEIIKAILAGEALEVQHPDCDWSAFNIVPTSIDHNLDVFLSCYTTTYTYAEFRLAPKTVRYQTRAYLVGTIIYVWTSGWAQTQEEIASMYLNSDIAVNFRWLEETQDREYTL